MLKKSLIRLMLFFVVTLLSGCYAVQLENLNRINKAALLSVYCSKEIDMQEFDGTAAFLSKLFQNADFELIPIADKVKNNFYNEYRGLFPFEILPETKVIQQPAYRNLYDSFVGQLGRFLKISVATNYFMVHIDNPDQMAEITRQIPEADGSIVVYLSYKLKKQGEFLGFGSARMLCLLNISVRTLDNKNAIDLTFEGKSKSVLKYSLGGVFDAKQIKDLCVDATEVTLVEFYESLQRQISYHTKRLARDGVVLPPKTMPQPDPNPVASAAAPAPVLTMATPMPTPWPQLAPEPPNRIDERWSARGLIGEHQIYFEDLNRSLISGINQLIGDMSSDPDSIQLMGEIKNNYGTTLQVEYGITRNLIIGYEYNYIPIQRIGKTQVQDYSKNKYDFKAQLDLPINSSGLNMKLAFPAGDYVLLKIGAGLEYSNISGHYSLETTRNGSRFSYWDSAINGNCFGTIFTTGMDVFFNRYIAINWELGYRMGIMKTITNEADEVLKFKDTGKNVELHLNGMITRAGVVVYF